MKISDTARIRLFFVVMDVFLLIVATVLFLYGKHLQSTQIGPNFGLYLGLIPYAWVMSFGISTVLCELLVQRRRRINMTLPCEHCGYNLMGLKPNGNCPICANTYIMSEVDSKG